MNLWSTLQRIAGSRGDTQALTSLGQLSQTWPVTGENVMHVLCDAVRNEHGSLAPCKFPEFLTSPFLNIFLCNPFSYLFLCSSVFRFVFSHALRWNRS